MRQAVALLLVWLLALPLAAKAPADNVRRQVLSVARDSAVEVRFTDKTKRTGRLGAVQEDGFELQTESAGKIETLKIQYDQVKSVRAMDQPPIGRSIGRVVLITGVVVGVIVGILVVVGLAANAATS
ncbi:MAG: hypothetical protein JNK87_17355 [Bryobacterales bacterium]|nr:hypothetical protein [Bryobacterales bacterium]